MTPEMTPEEEVRQATIRFYDALDELVGTGKTEAMSASWHHTPEVSSSHPFGPWLYGWDQIWATWLELAFIANKDRTGGAVRALKVHLYGDVAYVTGVYVASPALNNVEMNVTNILHRKDGEWKLVHHHADKAPSLEKAIAEEG